MPPTQPDQVLQLARTKGLLRARDLDPLGIPRAVLTRLVEQGALLRVGRGLYLHPETDLSHHHPLAQVAVRVPGGVINLISALAFHELTDEMPASVWVAVRRGSQAPRLEWPPLEITWTAPRFLEVGVTRHYVEGVDVPVTDAART